MKDTLSGGEGRVRSFYDKGGALYLLVAEKLISHVYLAGGTGSTWLSSGTSILGVNLTGVVWCIFCNDII